MSDEKRVSAFVTVQNETGLHARPASKFVQRAARYKSEIIIKRDEKEINAKSIMGVMAGKIDKGCEIELVATGDDAQEAIKDLVELVESRFGEDN